jgi:hypothetical protein
MSVLIAVVAMFGFLLAVEALGQGGMRWRGSGGWGPGGPYMKAYDPKTVETLSGEVMAVERFTPMKGMGTGVHLTLRTEKETVSVHLGPLFYLENQDVKIAPKDRVEVKGARVTFAGKPAIIAAEVKKGDQVLKLRDENGFPAWAAWRRP